MTESNDLKPTEYQALAEFRYQIRRFLRFSEEAAREAGIEPQHHQMMLAVKAMPHEEAVRIGELAERLQIRHHSAVELAGRLEEKGLIARSRDSEDRREVHVQLTPKGKRILRELSLYHRDELRSTAPELVRTLRRLTGETRSRSRLRRGGKQQLVERA